MINTELYFYPDVLAWEPPDADYGGALHVMRCTAILNGIQKFKKVSYWLWTNCFLLITSGAPYTACLND